MTACINLHLALEHMRTRALAHRRDSPTLDEWDDDSFDPPRIMVVGPENAGKTTICKILANYAMRSGQGWCPMFVNVDPSEVTCLFLHADVCVQLSVRADGPSQVLYQHAQYTPQSQQHRQQTP